MVVDTAGGELLCSNCGYVVKDKIEEIGPEWRAFSKEEKDDRSRTGIPSSLAMHDMGLATVMRNQSIPRGNMLESVNGSSIQSV